MLLCRYARGNAALAKASHSTETGDDDCLDESHSGVERKGHLLETLHRKPQQDLGLARMWELGRF